MQDGVDAVVVEVFDLDIGFLFGGTAGHELRQQARCGMCEHIAVGYVQAGLVGLNNHLGDHQRRAAQLEEVVGGTHLVHGEDAGEDVAEESLHLVGRSHILAFLYLYLRCRQCAPVDFLVLVERYLRQLHRGCGHHV